MKLSFKLNIPGVLALTLLASTPSKPVNPDGREVVIEQVPAHVKATLDRELPGANLSRGLLTEAGKSGGHRGVYDLDVTQADRDWNIQILATGDLVAKRRREA